ncbi:hypothetical protein PS918_02573 [Pseudomonas fluorescens]|uniref:Uncharacterized protein n=1 Tax=Pseudomonas fluorescens TaxID=294 RepID=A0A5E7SC70_PSEFL|nr:hypothetical protein [Pseudomonas fluorescens]VVP83819.1 hypothetical protein PS918_02573 [Pseudomonas fluorescens]
MGAPTIRKAGQGTINAIRKVWVDATPTQFAMVMPDDGCSRLAVRIGQGDHYFLVGDRVKYTLLMDQTGAIARAQDLVKAGSRPA